MAGGVKKNAHLLQNTFFALSQKSSQDAVLIAMSWALQAPSLKLSSDKNIVICSLNTKLSTVTVMAKESLLEVTVRNAKPGVKTRALIGWRPVCALTFNSLKCNRHV